MTELQLYKWVHDNHIEYHCHSRWAVDDNSIIDEIVYIYPNYYELEELSKMLSPSIFDDGGIELHWNGRYFCLDLIPIAEYYGIDINNICPKEEI